MIKLGPLSLSLKGKRDGLAFVYLFDRRRGVLEFEASAPSASLTCETAAIPVALWEAIEQASAVGPKLEAITRDIANVDFADQAEPMRTFSDVYYRLQRLSQEIRFG